MRGLPERQRLTAEPPTAGSTTPALLTGRVLQWARLRTHFRHGSSPEELCSPLKRYGLPSAEPPSGLVAPAVPGTGAEEHGTPLLAIGCEATEWRRTLRGRPACLPVSGRADRARRSSSAGATGRRGDR